MENLKDIFMLLMYKLESFGKLKKVSFYDDNLAIIEIEKEGRMYTLSIRSEEITDGNS